MGMINMGEDKDVKKKNNIAVTFRVFQAIFFGVFALGISMALGDYNKFIESPIASISITTTIFGLGGSIITGVMAKESERW
jgi:hypothetical protein